MNSVFQDKRFQRGVVVPSAAWAVLCAVYVSTSVGWGNLSALLTYELAMMALGLVLPVCLLAVLYGITRTHQISEALSNKIDQQGEAVAGLTRTLGQIREAIDGQVESNRASLSNALSNFERSVDESAKSSAEDIAAIKSSLARVQDAVHVQVAGIDSLKAQLEGVAGQLEAGSNQLDLDNIQQRTAVLGLVNAILNDVNVAITRLLVRMMESEGRTKPQIKDFIQGLVSAFSVGDRGVFVAVIQHQLSGNMERLVNLQEAANETPAVQQDVAKIIREIREIVSLFGRVDDPNVAKTICDQDVLQTLEKLLSTYFHSDGTSKETAVY